MQELDRTVREGAALHDAGCFNEALALYDAALLRWQDSAVLWNNRGNTLLELARFAEAAESYCRALQLVPDLHDARVALATCLQALGRVEEALSEVETVLAAAPDHAEAHWNRALLLLQAGAYPEGWHEYEWRWKKRSFTSPVRDFAQPQWQGEPLSGKSILIHAEQGFGDTIQFCRYLPLLAAAAARVVFECQAPLVPLMRGLCSGLEVVPQGAALPHCDFHLPLMSLPLVHGTTLAAIPAPVSYLQAPAGRLPFWHSVVPGGSELRIGLCWSRKPFPNPDRCCPAPLLGKLAGIGGARLFSLQVDYRGDVPPPLQMIDLTSQLRDFADTAALISCLDLVISVDTAVAHLAGALGKECWLLLSEDCDWRWLRGREDSPWYPAVRLLRQKTPGDWDELMDCVAKKLVSRTSPAG